MSFKNTNKGNLHATGHPEGLADHPHDQHFKNDLWPEPNRADHVFGSKAVDEPPFMRAISVDVALPDAIVSVSSEVVHSGAGLTV